MIFCSVVLRTLKAKKIQKSFFSKIYDLEKMFIMMNQEKPILLDISNMKTKLVSLLNCA